MQKAAVSSGVVKQFKMQDLQNHLRPYADIFDVMVDKLVNEFGHQLVAVAVTGSVQAGNVHADSDVDLCILWAKPYSQRRRDLTSTRQVDLFVSAGYRPSC